MGMFDYIICEYDIDAPSGIEWQTKDTPSQYLDRYKIAADGKMWFEDYDTADLSDPNDPEDFIGCMSKINERWIEKPDFRGEVRFYGSDEQGQWWEYSALFDNGIIINIKRITPSVDE
jgi:hypothetical protein